MGCLLWSAISSWGDLLKGQSFLCLRSSCQVVVKVYDGCRQTPLDRVSDQMSFPGQRLRAATLHSLQFWQTDGSSKGNIWIFYSVFLDGKEREKKNSLDSSLALRVLQFPSLCIERNKGRLSPDREPSPVLFTISLLQMRKQGLQEVKELAPWTLNNGTKPHRPQHM